MMDVDLIFKIAAIGIIVSVLNQVLIRSGREEQATMTTLALACEKEGNGMSLGAVIGFSLCAAALCVLLRQYRPEIALVISILCGVGVLLWLLEQLAPVLEQLQQLSNLALGSGGEAAQVLPDYAGRLRHLPGHRGDGHRRPAGNGGQGRDAAAVDAGFLRAAPAGAAADWNIKGEGR